MPSYSEDELIEKRPWAAADQLWPNSSLRPLGFSTSTLGLILPRYADHRLTQAQAALKDRVKQMARRGLGPQPGSPHGAGPPVIHFPANLDGPDVQPLTLLNKPRSPLAPWGGS